jgi:hypothetical protein
MLAGEKSPPPPLEKAARAANLPRNAERTATCDAEESAMKKWILSLVLASLAAVAWALPSLQDVEGEVQAGRWAQAETMMREVVAAKPDNAKAHYVYAEILAHGGKTALAAEEAQKARLIDPDVKFTDPEKFRSFEAALLQAQRPAARAARDARGSQGAAQVAPAAASPGIPSWVWLAGLLVIGVLLWRGFSRNRNAPLAGGMAAPGAAYGAGVSGQPGPQGPYGPGYPGTGYAPPRSSMLGTGLAAAGGVAAGMLASEMLHRHGSGNAVNDDSGAQPGFFDSPDSGRSALEDRPIDFGNGGDWDAGPSDAGGGFDAGGDGGWD